MPSFEIPDGPTTVPLKSEGGFYKGSAVFGVTNKTSEGLTARFSVQVQGDGKTEWYEVQGEPERPIAAGETQTVTVVAKIPGVTPAGQHRMKLRATNLNDPDNDSADSTAAAVVVPAAAAPKPKPKPFPWWILAVIGAVLVVVIGVIIAVVVMSSGPKVPLVVGKTYADATKAIETAGFKVGPRTDKEDGDKTPETVLAQDPEGGKKGKKGDPVSLTVAIAKVVAPEPPPPEEEPPTAACDPAVGTCQEGFVWRQAAAGDRVCVSPESANTAALENAQAAARRNPNGGPYGPDTCLQGFVWRDGFANDHVCVTVERRSIVAQENALGQSRYRACRPKIKIPRPVERRPRITLPAG